VRASPLARRIAQDNSIDLHSVEGSGPAGRVVRADVEAAIQNKSAAPVAAASTATPGQAGPDDEKVRLSQMRKTIARRMIESMNNPQFTVTMAIDVTELVDIRNRLEVSLKAVGDDTVLSINHVILRASALALRKVPEVNVSYTEDALIKHNRVNVGFAVAIPNGLVVPVVKDTDKKSIFEIARETNALVVKARAGKIEPADYSGGTFSVSNLGMFGVEEFQGIINPPESAILAVGAAGPEAVVIDGQIVIRERMRVTLSSDHRAVDGAIAARWLQALKQYLENPLLLVI
jgi:pyruvate dehydrogenase E2 component (dihydrolipoamide acetyltransferase)